MALSAPLPGAGAAPTHAAITSSTAASAGRQLLLLLLLTNAILLVFVLMFKYCVFIN